MNRNPNKNAKPASVRGPRLIRIDPPSQEEVRDMVRRHLRNPRMLKVLK